MPLKAKDHGELFANQEDVVIKWRKSLKDNEPYPALVQLLAAIADDAIDAGNSYITFGITRNADAIMLTCNQQGTKAFFTGATMRDLALVVAESLEYH